MFELLLAEPGRICAVTPKPTNSIDFSVGKSSFYLCAGMNTHKGYVYVVFICHLPHACEHYQVLYCTPSGGYRLSLRDQPTRQRLSRLNRELANRTKWDDAVARGSPHAAAVPLTEADLETRRTELHACPERRCRGAPSSTSSAAGPARPSGRPY